MTTRCFEAARYLVGLAPFDENKVVLRAYRGEPNAQLYVGAMASRPRLLQ
jgi:hypothetical protein